MATREPKEWITVNGVHVPIFEGQTKDEAVRKAIANPKYTKQMKENSKKTNRPIENTMENRNKLKKEIDDYVKAHPNPTEADRKKVSEMRYKYNTMMAEAYEKYKKKSSSDSTDADQKKLNDLHSEYYKLYKHDEDNIPGRDAKLNELEKQIHEMEGRIQQKKDQKTISDNEDLKEKQIAENKRQANNANGTGKTSRTVDDIKREYDSLKKNTPEQSIRREELSKELGNKIASTLKVNETYLVPRTHGREELTLTKIESTSGRSYAIFKTPNGARQNIKIPGDFLYGIEKKRK